MRRLGSALLNLWVAFFVPSLIVWVLMLRWSDTAARRFESIWRWTADRLAFPLVAAPLTDWAWNSLAYGAWLRATIGFLILTAVWALMLALPLVLVGGWWTWLASRLGKNTSSSTYDPYDVTPRLQASSSTIHSPLGAIYLVTIPLALFGASIRWLFSAEASRGHPMLAFFRPVVWTFIVVFLLYAGYDMLVFTQSDYATGLRYDLSFIVQDTWYGYLDTLRIPRLFDSQFNDAVTTTMRQHQAMNWATWDAYMGHWYRQPELRTILLLSSARHALGAAGVMLLLRGIGRLFK